MDTTGDHEQTSTSVAQSTPTTNECNSMVSWASAFQSLEFMLGLQTAVSQALRQYNAPTDQITQLESLGNPTQTATTSQAQVGDSLLQHNSGTFVAPLFIKSGSNSALQSQDIASDHKTVKKHLPKCFKPHYEDVHLMIDCTEIFIESPHKLYNKVVPGLVVDTPEKLSNKKQFTEEQDMHNRKNSQVRVLVEGAIRRVKVFRIF